jgi:cytochrome P450 family 619
LQYHSDFILDEWVDGKLLPKGTVVFVNVWGLHHDKTKIPDSDVFDPDHYKGRTASSSEYANSADYENRDHYGFGEFMLAFLSYLTPLLTYLATGNGRRLCPGIHLADRNLWHAISKLLWAFNFERPIDPQTGKPIALDTTVETGYREGLTMCPYEFPCKTTIRSEARRQVILKDLEEARANFFPQYEKVDLFMPKEQ